MALAKVIAVALLVLTGCAVAPSEKAIKPAPDPTIFGFSVEDWETPVLPECAGASDEILHGLWEYSIETEVSTAKAEGRPPEYQGAQEFLQFMCHRMYTPVNTPQERPEMWAALFVTMGIWRQHPYFSGLPYSFSQVSAF